MIEIDDDYWHLDVDLTSKHDREEIQIKCPWRIVKCSDLIKIHHRIGYVYQTGYQACQDGTCYVGRAYLCPLGTEDPEMWFKATNKQSYSDPKNDMLWGLSVR